MKQIKKIEEKKKKSKEEEEIFKGKVGKPRRSSAAMTDDPARVSDDDPGRNEVTDGSREEALTSMTSMTLVMTPVMTPSPIAYFRPRDRYIRSCVDDFNG